MDQIHNSIIVDPSEKVTNEKAGTVISLVIIFVDTILLTNLLINAKISCDGYLRTWVIGAIILSFFLFSFVKRIQKLLKENRGLFSEVLLMLLCFLWTYFGTIQINKSSACQKNAPFLFWAVFTLVTAIWCSIIGMILSLMIITVGSFFIIRSKVDKI
ncbi:conserved Plasmodium membrane protein, unknown function [Plasmodium gallinaceum]|uniref:Uncharacterized protein n=1 Tax=Plasmodium gallinaceum TaxID=5849 RepID=A0A1J1GXX7_PLAGA|nr:conserved Plasmodium membrane protein, unknown function [Plasmodium gallinaceum]CRG97412.1 conserved Plasmodium membrane protein, unknown function [Plasmodium gallinaceum]